MGRKDFGRSGSAARIQPWIIGHFPGDAHEETALHAVNFNGTVGIQFNDGVYRIIEDDGVLGEISADANDKLISVFDSDGRESYSRFSYLVADYLIDENMS